ncbi:MAG TPA: FAD-dependent oxidoreductase [bacterium]|nr:FAD-dependent oxidoreductase [bacterium]
MSSPDVLIVGAGLAGLSAAALLSADGVEVVVVEEDLDVGGKLRAMEREGFVMDGGLHCFHYGDSGPLGELDRRLGLGLTHLASPNASYILRGKNRLPVPPGAETDTHDVPGFTENEAARIRAWFGKLMEADPEEWRKKSVAEFDAASGFAADELVNAYAGALCLTVLGRHPSEVNAGLIISHGQAVGHPGFHVSVIAGGAGRLVRALAAKIGKDHARVVLGSRVSQISVDAAANTVTGVTATSEEFAPAAVIYAGPAQKLPGLLPKEKSLAPLLRKCKKQEPISGIALEMGLASRVCEIRGVMIDPEEAVIGRFPSNLDPSLAPEGAQLSSWLMLVPPEDLADVKTASSHIRRLKRLVARHFPEIEAQTKWERLRVIPIIASAAPLPSQPADKRPAVQAKPLSNLFLAGDGAAGKGLLSGLAVSTAMEAVDRIKKFLKERKAAAAVEEEITGPDEQD